MEDLADRERYKYETMWKFPQYRRFSPGEDSVESAIRHLGPSIGESFIDFGCGTGRPALMLSRKGYHVTAVDFAKNCLDPGMDGKFLFLQLCLWDLPDGLKADWGFCTDVMEHIPFKRIDSVLEGIKKSTRRGVFFQINCKGDNCGKLINDKLHLSVMPPNFWLSKMGEFWGSVHSTLVTPNEICIVCR